MKTVNALYYNNVSFDEIVERINQNECQLPKSFTGSQIDWAMLTPFERRNYVYEETQTPRKTFMAVPFKMLPEDERSLKRLITRYKITQ